MFICSFYRIWGEGILNGKCSARGPRKLSKAVAGWGKPDLISVLLLLLLLLLLLGRSWASGWLTDWLDGWLAAGWLAGWLLAGGLLQMGTHSSPGASTY